MPTPVRLLIRMVVLTLPLLPANDANARPGDEDDCRSQRAMFPARWNDTTHETILLSCHRQDVDAVVRVGPPVANGERQLSVTIGKKVYRAHATSQWLMDLRVGNQVELFARSEDSCATNFVENGVLFAQIAVERGEHSEHRITLLEGGELRWANCEFRALKKF